jgi:hypothetical protein
MGCTPVARAPASFARAVRAVQRVIELVHPALQHEGLFEIP